MEFVLHLNYGIFSLSHKALEKLVEKGWTVTEFKNVFEPELGLLDPDADIIYSKDGIVGVLPKPGYWINWFKIEESSFTFRSHPDVVSVVKEFRHLAGRDQDYGLRVVNYNISEDDYVEIDSYDGYEYLLLNGRKITFN